MKSLSSYAFNFLEVVGLFLVLTSTGIQIFVEKPANDLETAASIKSLLSRSELILTSIEYLELQSRTSERIKEYFKRYDLLTLPEVIARLEKEENEIKLSDPDTHQEMIKYGTSVLRLMEAVNYYKGGREKAAHEGWEARTAKDKYRIFLTVLFFIGSALITLGRMHEIYQRTVDKASSPSGYGNNLASVVMLLVTLHMLSSFY